MRSGIIRKTTSYIMGVPMNDMDINTPQMIYDRINSSDEFELKNISFDDKNICPMVTVGYRDMEFLVDLKIEPVSAITPDFIFCHPIPNEALKKLKQAQIGITTSLTFNDDNLASHHFQLKLLNCILPDAAAIVDFNVRRIFSPVWLRETARSSAAPGPSYIYSVNVAPDRENEGKAWVFTQGLNRCGFVELEVINADEKNTDFYATVLSIACGKAVTERKFPDEMEKFDIAGFDEERTLSVTWRYWKGEMSVYPEGVLGAGRRRPESQNMLNGVLFIWPVDGISRKPVRACELEPFSLENAVIEYTAEESRRMETLASETIPKLISGLAVPGAKAIVKIRTEAVKDGNVNYEYIWAEVDGIDNENVYCTAVHDTMFSGELKTSEKFQTSVKNISDWIINLKGTRIAPDNAFLIG